MFISSSKKNTQSASSQARSYFVTKGFFLYFLLVIIVKYWDIIFLLTKLLCKVVDQEMDVLVQCLEHVAQTHFPNLLNTEITTKVEGDSSS